MVVVVLIPVVVVVVVVVVRTVMEAVAITAVVVLLVEVIVVVKVVVVVVRVELLGVILVVVVRDLVCAGAVIGTLVATVRGDMRVGVLMPVSNMTVDLLMDALTSMTSGVLTEVNDDVLYVNANAGVMTALEFAMSGPLEEVRCSAAFNFWPMAALDCDRVLQA